MVLTEWSNELTVICSPAWMSPGEAVNTKEDAEVLNALMLGNKAWEEVHALRCVKISKIIDLI